MFTSYKNAFFSKQGFSNLNWLPFNFLGQYWRIQNGNARKLIFITCEHKTQFYTPKIGCKMGNLSWECLNGLLYTLVRKVIHLSTQICLQIQIWVLLNGSFYPLVCKVSHSSTLSLDYPFYTLFSMYKIVFYVHKL